MARYGLNKLSEGAYADLGPSNAMAQMPSLQGRLDQAVEQAKERLATVEEAREILRKNPDLERLLDLMQRGLF